MIDNPTFREMRNWHDISLPEDLRKEDMQEIYEWCGKHMQGKYVLGYVYLSVESEEDAFLFSIRFGTK